ncbi:MAG: HAD family hydrolase, partial [Candidatus Omnitrophica bacterium]|nr:HAD family hydrolase [Candidatus Omnitrophota bacterium]
MLPLVYSMQPISLVIFDLDGTLIDAYPAIVDSFNYAMRQCGYPLQEKRLICEAVG